MGASLGFTELASAESIWRNPARYLPQGSNPLIWRGQDEARYGIQLFGGDPESFYKAALCLAPFKPDLLDVNAGCPVPKVVKNGAGAALGRDPLRLAAVVKALRKASNEALGGIPVTVKIRTGWDAGSINYREQAQAAVDAGAAMVSLHGRTRSQAYEGKADWPAIADLASRLSVPVCASGDLFSPEAARDCLLQSGCAALMFARGAQGNPFIFRETIALLTGGAYEPPRAEERIATGLRHLRMMAGDVGEKRACQAMRSQFCAYTRGLPGGNKLRRALVQASTIAEYEAILT
jgi:nifR3 family TIM-barrel protein